MLPPTESSISSMQSSRQANIRDHRFAELALRAKLAIAWEIFRLQARIIFSHRFLWFMAGLLIYWIVVYAINYNQEMLDRMSLKEVLPWLLQLPLSALTIYLNMQLITSEKDNRTLEVMFTTAGSRYKVWLLRLGALNAILLILAVISSMLAFFTITEVPILPLAVHGFVPAFFVGAMTLYFAVKFRSGLAAGMVSAGVIMVAMMLFGALEAPRYFIYFNPYDMPRQLDPETWNLWMWQNRIGVVLAGGMLLFAALRGMEERERLLR